MYPILWIFTLPNIDPYHKISFQNYSLYFLKLNHTHYQINFFLNISQNRKVHCQIQKSFCYISYRLKIYTKSFYHNLHITNQNFPMLVTSQNSHTHNWSSIIHCLTFCRLYNLRLDSPRHIYHMKSYPNYNYRYFIHFVMYCLIACNRIILMLNLHNYNYPKSKIPHFI